MPDPKKVFTISMRVSHALKTRLEAAAAEDGRSVSNLITAVLTRHLDRRDAGTTGISFDDWKEQLRCETDKG